MASEDKSLLRVNVEDVRQKLKSFYGASAKIDLAGRNYTYGFLKYLAGTLKGETMIAEEFLMAVALAFMDLRRGAGPDGKPLRHYADGLRIWLDDCDRIAAAEPFIMLDLRKHVYPHAFAPEFAAELAKVEKEVRRDVEDFMKNDKSTRK